MQIKTAHDAFVIFIRSAPIEIVIQKLQHIRLIYSKMTCTACSGSMKLVPYSLSADKYSGAQNCKRVRVDAQNFKSVLCASAMARTFNNYI